MERIVLNHVEGSRTGDVDAFCQLNIVIGRAPECHLVFPDARSTSSHHAVIRQISGRVELTDTRSTNGTFVNDERIERCDLNDGDTIRFGALGPLVRIAFPERRQSRTTRDMPVLSSDLLGAGAPPAPSPERSALDRHTPAPFTLAETRRAVSLSFMRNAGVIYVGAAFAATQGLDIISNKYGLRREVFTTGLILMFGGFFTTLITAYYHGAAGTQRIGRKELLMHGAVAVVTAIVLAVAWIA